MNIRFLGTGYGLLKSKKRNTKDFRRPASLLIDNEILIDPTSEVFSFAEDYGLTGLFRDVHTVLITTIDEERFSAETLLSLLKNGKKICICAESYVRPLIPDHPLITFVEMRANEIFDVQGAKVIPIPTVYHTTEIPQSDMRYAQIDLFSIFRMADFCIRKPGSFFQSSILTMQFSAAQVQMLQREL